MPAGFGAKHYLPCLFYKILRTEDGHATLKLPNRTKKSYKRQLQMLLSLQNATLTQAKDALEEASVSRHTWNVKNSANAMDIAELIFIKWTLHLMHSPFFQ